MQLGACLRGFRCGVRSTQLRPRSCMSPHKSRNMLDTLGHGSRTNVALVLGSVGVKAHTNSAVRCLGWAFPDPRLDLVAYLQDLYQQIGTASLSRLAQK